MNTLDNIFDYMHRNRKTLQLLLGLLTALFVTVDGLKAQSTEGFIYGKVYTRSNSYIGQIRWGKEEAFWNDHFNAAKIDNVYESFQTRERDNDRDFDWRLSSIWEDRSNKTTHLFSCQFGDIQEIINYGDNRVVVKLKNQENVKLSGKGYNDVGSSIVVLDDDLGKMSIKWDRISKIEFLPTPKNIDRHMGKPMFGTVETYRKGTLKGFVQWDHDERLGTDKLDGDTRDGDVSIPFNKISKIERDGNGSLVDLKSGRQIRVTGTNDVDNSNKGIIVTVDNIGKIDVPWKAFKSVTFENVDNTGSSYTRYPKPLGLKGTVYQYDSDEELTGGIIFDLDETWELEMLEGKDDEIEYKIPFRNIKSIEPKNYNYSIVTLRNGKELLLGNARDVTEENSGLLIFKRNEKSPIHIKWREITKIVFQ